MRQFKPKPGTRSATWILHAPFADITAFTRVVRGLVLANPLGCTAYRGIKRTHPPLEIVRETYTAKFVYTNERGKQAGTGQEMYDSVDGYELGVASMISNMANIAAHRGKVRHVRDADHFFVLIKCHDPDHGLFFVSISRDRLTVASYTDDAIKKLVETWADTVPELS